jgi:hypothetical protein
MPAGLMEPQKNHTFVGRYKLPLGQYTCIGRVVACSFQQGYDRGSNPEAVQVPWHTFVGRYKLPLGQYTCIARVVACSFQQKYDFSQVLLRPAEVLPTPAPSGILVPGVLSMLTPIGHLSAGVVQ